MIRPQTQRFVLDRPEESLESALQVSSARQKPRPKPAANPSTAQNALCAALAEPLQLLWHFWLEQELAGPRLFQKLYARASGWPGAAANSRRRRSVTGRDNSQILSRASIHTLTSVFHHLRPMFTMLFQALHVSRTRTAERQKPKLLDIVRNTTRLMRKCGAQSP